MADGLANRLMEAGIGKCDRVGVRLSQSAFTAAAHISIWKTGAISLPLSPQFGDDALHFRLADSGARAVITDLEGSKGLASISDRLPALELVLLPGSRSDASYGTMVEAADTAADDPALLMYTSGTTGPAKGVLHAHRVLLGHLPGVEISHDLFPQPGDVIWTPADWSWIGGTARCADARAPSRNPRGRIEIPEILPGPCEGTDRRRAHTLRVLSSDSSQDAEGASLQHRRIADGRMRR